jgi:hypothetical protein
MGDVDRWVKSNKETVQVLYREMIVLVWALVSSKESMALMDSPPPILDYGSPSECKECNSSSYFQQSLTPRSGHPVCMEMGRSENL